MTEDAAILAVPNLIALEANEPFTETFFCLFFYLFMNTAFSSKRAIYRDARGHDSGAKERQEQSDVEESPDLHSGSAEYAERFAGLVGKWMLRIQEQALLKSLEGLTFRSALDIGGGHGHVTLPLARRGVAVQTVVSSQRAAFQLQELLKSEENAVRERVSIVVSSLFAPPAKPGEFDVVVSFRILSHMNDWSRFIGTLCGLASKAVLVDYPSQKSLNFFARHLFSVKKNLEGNTRPFRTFRAQELETLFRSYGYNINRSIPQFFLPMVVHRSLRNPRLSDCTENLFYRCRLLQAFGSPVIVRAERV